VARYKLLDDNAHVFVSSAFELPLAPGETKSLLQFVSMHDTNYNLDSGLLLTTLPTEGNKATSALDAIAFKSIGTDELLTGISDDELATIVNYAQLSPVVEPSEGGEADGCITVSSNEGYICVYADQAE
jgi:hypothetical protein